jgi:hypothetical protein
MYILLLKELVNTYFASGSTLLIFCSEAQVLLCLCFCVYCNLCVKFWYLTCLYFLHFCCLLCAPVLTSRTRSVFSRVFLCIGVLILCTLEYLTVFYRLLSFRLFVHFWLFSFVFICTDFIFSSFFTYSFFTLSCLLRILDNAVYE